MNPTVGVGMISPCVFSTADGVCRQVHGSFKLWVLNHLSKTQLLHNCQVVPFSGHVLSSWRGCQKTQEVCCWCWTLL